MASREDLIEAAQRGDKGGVLRCLQRGDDIDQTDDYERTALFYAIEQNNEEIAIILLENGANYNRRDKFGLAPSMLAAKNGLIHVVSLLIEKGLPVDDSNIDGDTSLIFASGFGHKNIVNLLLEKGARVNAKDNQKWTALHRASSRNHPEVVSVLLKNGADVNARNNDGKTALDYAKEMDYPTVVSLLKTDDGSTRELRQVMRTLNERVDGIEEERRGNEQRMNLLTERMFRLEEEIQQKEGQIETLIERDNRLEDDIRFKDGQIEALTEWVSQWMEEKREMNERTKELAERFNRFEEDKNAMSGELVKLRWENCDMERQLLQLKTKLEGSRDNCDGAARSLDSNDKNKMSKLESKINEVERVKYSDTVEILGVEEKPGEDLELILVTLARVLGLPVPEDVIEVSRFPFQHSSATKRPRVILVKFGKVETARSWLAAFKERMSSGILASRLDSSLGDELIFINQKLTSFDKKLLRRVKQFAKDKEYKFVWVQEGKILLRKDQDSPVIRIKTTNDIPSK